MNGSSQEERTLDESLLLSLPDELIQGGDGKKEIKKASVSSSVSSLSFSFLDLSLLSGAQTSARDETEEKPGDETREEDRFLPDFARWRQDERDDDDDDDDDGKERLSGGGYAFDARTCTRIFLFPQASQYLTSGWSPFLSSFGKDLPPEETAETRPDSKEGTAETGRERTRRRGKQSLRRRDKGEQKETEKEKGEEDEEYERGPSPITQGIVTYFPYYEEETSGGDRLLRESMHQLYALVESWRYTFGIAERRDLITDRISPPHRSVHLSPPSLSPSQKAKDSPTPQKHTSTFSSLDSEQNRFYTRATCQHTYTHIYTCKRHIGT